VKREQWKGRTMTIKERVLCFQNILVVFCAILLVVISGIVGNFESTKFLGSYRIDDVETWTLGSKDDSSMSVQLPGSINMIQGQPFTLTSKLPDQFDYGYGYMVQSNYCQIEVYANDILLDTYAKELPTPFGRMTGNIRVITEIPQEYAGGSITIKATPYYTAHMSLNPIYAGNIDALKLDIMYKNLWRLMLATIILVVAIVCLGISGYHFYYKATKNNWAFYHMGAMLVYLDCWLMCSSDVPQIFTSANGVVSFISFVSLAILPVHMAAFYEELFPCKVDMYRYLQFFGWILAGLEVLGYATSLWDPVAIFYIGHIILVITIIVAIVEGFLHKRESTIAAGITRANFFLIFAIGGALICFYISPTSGLDAIFAGIGITLYAFYLFVVVLRREAQILEDIKSRDLYRELAFKDMQTNLKNRGAFNLDMAKVDLGECGETYVDLIIMDLNFLKRTNDKYGHLAGDVLINTAADCIERAFGTLGECYRIGGDEFAVLVFDKHDMIDLHLESFYLTLDEINRDNDDMPLSISVGMSHGRFSGSSKFMENIFSEADKAMYENKKLLHEKINKRYAGA